MARHHLSDPRVQAVVDGLVQGFVALSSVNALADAMTEALAQSGEDVRIYPNRVHGLLSDDPDRSVNTGTLEVLERALSRIDMTDANDRWQSAQIRVAAALAAQPPGESAPVRAVADELGLPPTVVASLAASEQIGSGGGGSDRVRTAPKEEGTALPDWSWQQDALAAVRYSLKKNANAKVGLIVPTGGGKTRLGVQSILHHLADDGRADAVCLWVTHRLGLKRMARRELQDALATHEPVPEKAADLFSRIHFVMIQNIDEAIELYGDRISLVVVDEAHHAAAPSYAPLIELASPGVFLTATPNRSDALPIGIDEVAFTISYRELFARGCVIEPQFHPPLNMEDLDWGSAEGLKDLADYLLDQTEDQFTKVLVAVSRTGRAEKLHEALVDAHTMRVDHPLADEDLAFVHGSSNSAGVADASDFLDEFSAHPAGILVATSQLVGEGFDDPRIDAVVVTYPSSSIGHLMQVAGRALRWAPGKSKAHVVQVHESDLEYHFDQRWLYQDISDALRPRLLDFRYSSADDLESKVQSLLDGHRAPDVVRARVLAQLHDLPVGGDLHLLLSGVQFFGPAAEFADTSVWTALLVDGHERERFLRVFNDVSVRTEDVKDQEDYLRRFLPSDSSPGSSWKAYVDMIHAMEYARREIHGEPYYCSDRRDYKRRLPTSWLRYVTFTYQPVVPAELDAFLVDAINRSEVLAAYTDSPDEWAVAIRVLLPLAGSIAYLLDPAQAEWFTYQRDTVIEHLRRASPGAGFDVLREWEGGHDSVPIASRVLLEMDQFTRPDQFGRQYLGLGDASQVTEVVEDQLSAAADGANDA